MKIFNFVFSAGRSSGKRGFQRGDLHDGLFIHKKFIYENFIKIKDFRNCALRVVKGGFSVKGRVEVEIRGNVENSHQK